MARFKGIEEREREEKRRLAQVQRIVEGLDPPLLKLLKDGAKIAKEIVRNNMKKRDREELEKSLDENMKTLEEQGIGCEITRDFRISFIKGLIGEENSEEELEKVC